jgi:alpha-beta hydrolase superfamily lysophospholipase
MVNYKKALRSTHKTWHLVFWLFLGVVTVVIIGLIGLQWYHSYQANQYQASLEPFYTPPSPLPSTKPGSLIRTEPMNISVPQGGSAYRMLYTTQLADGTSAVSSGMVFVPSGVAPAGGRKVVAWAHGTLGFGNSCTPSRSSTPMNDMQNWLDGMMQRGWVVATTDYTGIGTPGNPYYLIGQSEAHDVLNSVRAARQFAPASAGTEFAVWGHSQGGNSALFAAQYASSYAPELRLVAASAAAPAAELNALFAQQYNQLVAWAIGPDAAVSWPLVYPDLPLKPVMTDVAYSSYQKLAYGCVQQEVPGLEVRAALREKFFQTNPTLDIDWYRAAQQQTPNVGSLKVPVYVAQGLSDTVVLPNTTALLAQKACSSGVRLTTNWLGNTSHTEVAIVAGPSLVSWLQDRFDNLPAPSSCSQPLPLSPAEDPPVPVPAS